MIAPPDVLFRVRKQPAWSASHQPSNHGRLEDSVQHASVAPRGARTGTACPWPSRGQLHLGQGGPARRRPISCAQTGTKYAPALGRRCPPPPRRHAAHGPEAWCA
eukprot:5467525-Pyramimonas_sp.AAC.1